MSDRLRRLDDQDLGSALRASADLIAWPEEPAFAAPVSRAIHDRERRPSLMRPRLSLPSRRRTIVLTIVGLLLVGGAALAAKLVIDLGALTIDVIPGRPTGLPSAIAGGPALGHRATLAQAERLAGFRAAVPSALGRPDAVWTDEAEGGTRIVLAWRSTPSRPSLDGLPWHAVLYEFHGDAPIATKLLYAQGDVFAQARVDGRGAFWISGPHELDLLTAAGTFERFRVSGNVLVWRANGVVLRLETEMSKGAAVGVAASVPDRAP